MKRILLAIVAAVLALGPSVAAAATPQSGTFRARRGEVQLGYDLSFTVDRGGSRIRGLVAHVLEQCSGSSTSSVTTVAPDSTWRVRGGRFAGRLKERVGDLTVYYTLEGRFTNPRTARGTLRQESIVAGATCDTYRLRFTARR